MAAKATKANFGCRNRPAAHVCANIPLCHLCNFSWAFIIGYLALHWLALTKVVHVWKMSKSQHNLFWRGWGKVAPFCLLSLGPLFVMFKASQWLKTIIVYASLGSRQWIGTRKVNYKRFWNVILRSRCAVANNFLLHLPIWPRELAFKVGVKMYVST